MYILAVMTQNILHLTPVVVRSVSRKVRDVVVQMEPIAKSMTYVLGMAKNANPKGEVA